MARALVAGPLTPPFINNRKNSHRCWCSPRSNNGRDGSPAIKIIVEGVTELLRLFSPKKPRDSFKTNREQGPSVPSFSSVDDVLEVIQDDYRRAYFLTGDFTPDIYTEDCLFEDPTIKFCGEKTLWNIVNHVFSTVIALRLAFDVIAAVIFSLQDKYGQNLDLLVPFFDNPSLELEQIQKGLSPETSFILASWKLRTYLKLPWRPLISIKGQTTYNLDKDYKITKHSESWNISATEAIGQIFGFNSRE